MTHRETRYATVDKQLLAFSKVNGEVDRASQQSVGRCSSPSSRP